MRCIFHLEEVILSNLGENVLSDKKNIEERSDEIAIIDERTILDKIYEVRGVKVMLDFELAEIYGYETKNFNRQVKNNAERFEGDEFMFQLTRDEIEELSRCKNFTSIHMKGVKGGRSYLPYAFTEQGVYLNDCASWGNCSKAKPRPCYGI